MFSGYSLFSSWWNSKSIESKNIVLDKNKPFSLEENIKNLNDTINKIEMISNEQRIGTVMGYLMAEGLFGLATWRSSDPSRIPATMEMDEMLVRSLIPMFLFLLASVYDLRTSCSIHKMPSDNAYTVEQQQEIRNIAAKYQISKKQTITQIYEALKQKRDELLQDKRPALAAYI